MNTASLDQAKVAELEELQEGLFERLALLFLQESPTDMALLGDALAAGDAAGAKTTAHRIKGSAAAVGAVGVSSGASDLEQAAGRGDVPAARRALGHLEGALGALRQVLRSSGVVPPAG